MKIANYFFAISSRAKLDKIFNKYLILNPGSAHGAGMHFLGATCTDSDMLTWVKQNLPLFFIANRTVYI